MKVFLNELLQIFEDLITAAEIIDGQEIPEKDDLDYLSETTDRAREMLNNYNEYGILGID